jgi:Family of unknown function (DUF6445)
MPLSVIIFDDFFDHPMKLRADALKLNYPKPKEKQNWPGRNGHMRLFVPGLDEAVSRIVGEPVVGAAGTAHCCFRLSLAGDDDDRLFNVHIDEGMWWAGIAYLTLPEHCQGGTEFFRHKETHSDRAPIYPEELKKHNAKDFSEAGWRIISRDSTDMSKWEPVMMVPMRFNRLVLLRPWLWHTAGKSFGTSIENGRLIQTYFFKLRA